MSTSVFLANLSGRAVFDPARMRKLECFRSPRLLVGLNCLEPGQSHNVHTHRGADKFYLVLSGRARITVGEDTREAGAGDLVMAPADVPHGIAEALERTVLLVAVAPAP